jgi:hypothetical protein
VTELETQVERAAAQQRIDTLRRGDYDSTRAEVYVARTETDRGTDGQTPIHAYISTHRHTHTHTHARTYKRTQTLTGCATADEEDRAKLEARLAEAEDTVRKQALVNADLTRKARMPTHARETE